MAERVSQDAAGSKHNDPPRGPPGVPGPPLIPRRLPGLPGGEPRNTSVPYSLVAHKAIRPEQTETDFARTRKLLRNRQRKDSPDAEQKGRYQGTLGWSRRYPGTSPQMKDPQRGRPSLKPREASAPPQRDTEAFFQKQDSLLKASSNQLAGADSHTPKEV